jgi:hypothetical protein
MNENNNQHDKIGFLREVEKNLQENQNQISEMIGKM